MPDVPGLLALVIGQRPTPLFGLLLLVHVPAGLTCVMTGAVAMLCEKHAGPHPRFGTIYFWALAVVFVSATAMAALRWSEDVHLFVLGSIAFSFGLVG